MFSLCFCGNSFGMLALACFCQFWHVWHLLEINLKVCCVGRSYNLIICTFNTWPHLIVWTPQWNYIYNISWTTSWPRGHSRNNCRNIHVTRHNLCWFSHFCRCGTQTLSSVILKHILCSLVRRSSQNLKSGHLDRLKKNSISYVRLWGL